MQKNKELFLMNMNLINKVIDSYNKTLNESDQARLKFFQGLWEEMQRWSTGPVAAVNSYEFPDQEHITAAWDRDEAIFSLVSVDLSADRLVAIFNALRNTYTQSAMTEDKGNDELLGIDAKAVLTSELLSKAAKDPESFAQELFDALKAKVSESTARIAVMLMMLALRVEFEPIAQKLMKQFPKGDDIHHHPLRCPVCGSSPALARVGGEGSPTDGRGRSLYCQQCGCVWDFERIRCARCGTRNQGHLHYFNIEGDDGHRIATCDECGDYIRTVFLEESLMPFSFEVEEVVTARLDAVARDPRFQPSDDNNN